MPAHFKTRKIIDEDHLSYVRRQSCIECQAAALSLDPVLTMKRKRLSDPHHLKNTRHPRRFFDWFTIPLCRIHHSYIDSLNGLAYELRNWPRFMRVAGNMLYRNGRITGERLDALLRCGDDREMIGEWVDTLIAEGQNWDGGTI